MGDYLLKRWQKGAGRLRGLKRTRKNNIILGILVLVLSTGLFFYHFSGTEAAVRKVKPGQNINPEVLDPLNKIGKGLKKEDNKLCDMVEKAADKGDKAIEEKMLSLLDGHPIEAMVKELSKKDKEVASFVFAIAKKESDWGKHAPHKNGRDCYNYWGYKGGYNLTQDGYSCFDNPEQAVDVVSDRIASLVEKQINTPEKMVVWKCGSSCAGHDPGGVAKWIADVRMYKTKLN